MSKVLLITNAYNQYVYEALEQRKYDKYVLSCISPLNAELILEKYHVSHVYDIYTFLEYGDSEQLDDFYIQMMRSPEIPTSRIYVGQSNQCTIIDGERFLTWSCFFENRSALIRPGARLSNIPVEWRCLS